MVMRSKPLLAEVLLVEQTAAKIDAGERRVRAEVLEVDTREPRAVRGSHFLEKRPDRAADVEHVAVGAERTNRLTSLSFCRSCRSIAQLKKPVSTPQSLFLRCAMYSSS